MTTLSELRNRILRKAGERDRLQRDMDALRERLSALAREIGFSEAAQTILQTIARQTQEELQYHISEPVSLALAAIFDNPYKFVVEFELRRGKTECDLMFERDGYSMHPMASSGGGPILVASFALRIALWSLARPRTRNTLILDEPFRFLRGLDMQSRASNMIKEISEKLGLQIIMVTHEPELAEAADRVLTISKGRDGRSKVEVEG